MAYTAAVVRARGAEGGWGPGEVGGWSSKRPMCGVIGHFYPQVLTNRPPIGHHLRSTKHHRYRYHHYRFRQNDEIDLTTVTIVMKITEAAYQQHQVPPSWIKKIAITVKIFS